MQRGQRRTFGPADANVRSSQALDVGGGGVLDALIGMMDFGSPCRSTPRRRRRLVEGSAELPAADLASEDVEEDGQVDEAGAESDVGDVGGPDLIGSDDFESIDFVENLGKSWLLLVVRTRLGGGSESKPRARRRVERVFR